MATQLTQEVIALDQQHILGTYGRFPMVLVKGRGTRVWDADGKEYLDFLAGIAVSAVGHCHPRVVQAVQEQAADLMHVSNFYYTRPMAELARLLASLGIGDKMFFCNSGAEANEGAFKLARKYHWRRGDKGRCRILSATGSFHGRTLATLTATANEHYQEGFGPLPQGFGYVPFNDAAALEQAVDDTVAAVILEAVQGEGGVTPATREYLQAAREITRQKGALLIMDEIQCGMGRTGTFFAFQQAGIEPDIVTLAKAMGGGLPMGCFAGRGPVVEGLKPGDHGSTFGGNPVAAAAAVATIQVILEEKLMDRAVRLGQYFVARLKGLQARHPCIQQVRGLGLMVGAVLDFEGRSIVEDCRQHGLLLNCTAGTVLRFLPPYTVTEAEIDQAVAIVDAALTRAGK